MPPHMQYRSVTLWLLLTALMVFIMAVIGAITRLTESGLSIMEWAPVTGFLPPLSETEWQRLFALYQQTDEFRIDNPGMELTGFKSIFWWEWIHRFWGRLIGLVFGLPLLWFWVRGVLPRWIKPHLIAALFIGGAQGFIGWFMVASGFFDGLTDVSPLRLTLHLMMALLIYGYLILLALKLGWPGKRTRLPQLRLPRITAHFASLLLLLTLITGGLTAGSNAGLIYNEWPGMGGNFVPVDYFIPGLGWLDNALSNASAIQFHHRWLAAATLLFTGLTGLTLLLSSFPLMRVTGLLLGAAVCGQFALGIITLYKLVPVWAGALHQAGAITVLTLLLIAIYTSARVQPAKL